MRTEFTREEIYQAYVEEVQKFMVKEMDLTHEKTDQIIKSSGFHEQFINNMSDYDFAEPGEVAEELVHSIMPRVRRRHRFRTTYNQSHSMRSIRGPKTVAVRIARAGKPDAHKAESSSLYGK